MSAMRTTARIALCAVLTALALGLSYMEHFLPLTLWVPLPGIKLGLANVVTLLTLLLFGVTPALAVLLARCFLGALFAGSLSGLLFSLAGGLLALGTMALVRRSGLSVYGISVCGAAAHQTGQVLTAVAVLRTASVLYYLPPLLLVGTVCGLLTGAAASGVLRALLTDDRLRTTVEGWKK